MFIGFGTVVNAALVLVGSLMGLGLGSRIPERTRELTTEVLGLFTLVLGGQAVAAGFSEALSSAVGSHAPMLLVLGALLLGGAFGSGVQLENRLDNLAEWARRRFSKDSSSGGSRFAEGAVSATLVFCVGPMSILGSLNDGLGLGADMLVVKSVMDGFAAIAFAASFGIGVAASIAPMVLYQGTLTLLGMLLGDFLSTAQVDALGATGGIMLLGLGLRLIGAKRIAVANLLPALFLAPLLVWLVGLFN
ncbi:MAG: DUF554 domain-containing protein [Propionibacteriaceae bacterium]|nr:DUF554 domain-containing protein [Propionibacteriaceae bacterium]